MAMQMDVQTGMQTGRPVATTNMVGTGTMLTGEVRYLKTAEVCKLLRLKSRQAVYRRVQGGTLRGTKVGGPWRFSESDVLAYLRECERLTAAEIAERRREAAL